MDHQRLNNSEGSCNAIWDKSDLNISDQVTITIHYDQTTHLTMLHDYNIIYITTEYLYMTGCVIIEKKQNLNNFQKLLLQWNFKLWHTGFSTVQWIGRQVWMGNLVEKMVSNSVKITKCAACQYGKQERNTNLQQRNVSTNMSNYC